MDFNLSKEHQMLRTLYREFAENEAKPIAQEIDEEERFPQETVDKMVKNGFMGIPIAKEDGGQGCDTLAYILAVEELSRVCGTTGVILSAHTSLGMDPIRKFGTPDQKAKYLPRLAKGELLGAFGLTEPGAGTDASGQQTKAVLEGDHYVLNGTKIFITNGGKADVYIIFAMTDKSKGTKGISAFIVEKDFPGFSIGTKEKKMGIRGSSTTELIFEDCIVPKENLLGKEGKGFGIAMQTLDGGRIGIAAQALGLAQGAFDETVAYVKERKQFGRSIAKFQNTQFKLADMYARIEAARNLVYKAAIAKDTQKVFSVEAATAKLFAAETAMAVTTECVQLLGGYGYTRDYPVERMMRDAKITEIYEGTSEVQRMVISGNVLKQEVQKEEIQVNIVVCVKQVPDTNEVKLDPVTGTLIRDGVPSIMNPDDKAGLEAALELKDATGAHITVVSMGPPQADDVLREALAMGADEAILVTDRAFGGADTWATSTTIAAAVKMLDYDLIITGRQAIDGDTAQVGPQIAEHLNIPNVSYAEDIKVEGDSVIVKRQYEDRYHTIKVQMPCLVTALGEMNTPRYMTPGGIFDAYRTDEVKVWTLENIDVDTSNIGLKGSPTRVFKSFPKALKPAGTVVQLDPQESADFLLEKLKEKFII